MLIETIHLRKYISIPEFGCDVGMCSCCFCCCCCCRNQKKNRQPTNLSQTPYTLKLFVSSLRKSEQFSIDFISFMFIRCNSSNPCSSTSNIHQCPHPHANAHPTHLGANTIHTWIRTHLLPTTYHATSKDHNNE